jgi:hypothetical protein
VSPIDASASLRAANEDLEALRTEAARAILSKDPADEPIRAAWRIAQNRYRQACKVYAESP